MKKVFCVLLAVFMLCGFCLAENVYVTISDDHGSLVLVDYAVEMQDADGDGSVNIADALYLAHDAAYPGGAEAGFTVHDAGYGISIAKLWGVENGGSYGFYLNNGFAYSLADPISEGDHVRAYAFTDLETWSDTFSYFDAYSVETAAGESFVLNLSVYTYDADWNPIVLPVEGAVITIDGQDSAFMTDAEGNAAISIDAQGSFLLSAHSDVMNLVPPTCIVEVK